MRHIAKQRRTLGVAASAIVILGAVGTVLAAGGGTSGTGFTSPVQIPNSTNLGEPNIAIDSTGQLFVTAPQALGNITTGGSKVWTSTTGGTSWNSGVKPTGDPVSGGDTDVAVDAADNVYQTDLWLGDSAMAVSTNHGQSFIANEYGHTTPADDRPWLAYSKKDNALYLLWDGFSALYVQKSAPLVAPQLGILPGQTTPVIAESAVSVTGSLASAPVRMCVCPPGGIAVDQSSGQVYVTYSRQNGGGAGGAVGIARSDNSGLTWTQMSIPGTGSTGSAFDVEWNFIPVKVDSAGTVYAAWGELSGGSVATKYAYSNDHGATWSTPTTLSTTSGTTTFPTLDVVSPGVIDVAWYGTSATGDPNFVGGSTSWDVDFAQVTAANTATPSVTPVAAVKGIHTGCIQVGNGGCSDRSLLDYFQVIADHNGKADFIYSSGDAASGTALFFVHQN